MGKKEFLKRNEKVINRFVRGFLAKNKVGIVHGTRATNAQLPRSLNRKTQDWDVFVKRPKVRAKQVEKLLDKRFRGDVFKVKKGQGSPGIKVFKVKTIDTDEGIVDFATPNRVVPSVAKRGVKFATLQDQVDVAKRTIRRKSAPFRREKDLDLIRRVNKFRRRKL